MHLPLGRCPARPGVALLAVVVALAGTGGLAAGCGAGHAGDGPPPAAISLYAEPKPDDFRAAYDGDAANGRVQTWDQYWGWVRTYYRGNFLAGGWAAESRTCLERVTDPAARRDLTVALNDLGRLGAGEWAKDAGVRKISTDDVRAWGKRIDKARRADDGTGAAILATVRTIRAEAERKVGPKPSP